MINRSFLVLTFLAAISAYADFDESGKEDYFYKIYRRYNAHPTAQDIWEKSLNERKSQEYTLVKGDTLWDVSRTLFGDGYFWAKIWSLNPYIKNPHLIQIGQVIHFYPGSSLDAPGLNVNHSTNTPVLSPQSPLSHTYWWKSQELPPVAIELDGAVIPPPQTKYNEVLETFPSSLPNWYFQTDSAIEKAPLEILEPVRDPFVNILSLPFFISQGSQNIKGRVFEIEKNAKTASEGDFLFIDADEDLVEGSIYTLIRNIGKIHDPESVGIEPNSFEVQGEVQIVGRVEGLFKAVVKRALFPVTVGAEVIPGNSPSMNLTDPGTPGTVRGMIIGGENDNTRSLFGPQSIVYVNRGSQDGIVLNQRLPIMAVHRLRHAQSLIYSNTWKLGELKIVKVENNFSTAVVLEATDGIFPGDIVGELKASDVTEEFKKIDDTTEFGDEFEDILIPEESKKQNKSETDNAPSSNSKELGVGDEAQVVIPDEAPKKEEEFINSMESSEDTSDSKSPKVDSNPNEDKPKGDEEDF